jgi:hypothetical protein
MYDIIQLLEKNDKLGFYIVNGQKYHNKIQALIEATNHKAHPVWNFNQKTFECQDWCADPLETISELYRMRAQQLRDQYDYIILNLSGGADSTTALYSFVNNGIFIDEVIVRHPQNGLKNLTVTDNTTVADNAYSEWKFAAVPLLDWLRGASPNTKITIHDYSDHLQKPQYEEDWVFLGRDYLHPGIVSRYKYDIDWLKSVYESHTKVCMLFGIDKPRICIRNGSYYLYFLDIQANTAVSEIKEYDNIETEFFYWTPDLPKIVIKQAHMIVDWFESQKNPAIKTLLRWPNKDVSQRTTYEMIVKTIIYPDYDFNTFQTAKPTSCFETEIDFWFYKNFQGTRSWQIWQKGLEFVKSNIDSQWFNYRFQNKDGFVGFISPFYKIKDMKIESHC